MRVKVELEEAREESSRLKEQADALKDYARNSSTELQESQQQIEVIPCLGPICLVLLGADETDCWAAVFDI